MICRAEWLRFIMLRYSRPKDRARQVLHFLAFEAYYHLCKFRGYRPRHFLEPLPEGVRNMPPGTLTLFVWPRLPLSIRLLDKIFYSVGHAEIMPYTPEAAEAARASGCRVAAVESVAGEFIGLNPG